MAAILLQRLVLEHIDEPQLKQLFHLVAVEVDRILAEKNVVLQKFLVINIFVAVFDHAFDLFDEQLVQGLGAECVDGNLRLRKQNCKHG